MFCSSNRWTTAPLLVKTRDIIIVGVVVICIYSLLFFNCSSLLPLFFTKSRFTLIITLYLLCMYTNKRTKAIPWVSMILMSFFSLGSSWFPYFVAVFRKLSTSTHTLFIRSLLFIFHNLYFFHSFLLVLAMVSDYILLCVGYQLKQFFVNVLSLRFK